MMNSKKLVSAILAAASIAGGVVSVYAITADELKTTVDDNTSRVRVAETNIRILQTTVKELKTTTGVVNNALSMVLLI